MNIEFADDDLSRLYTDSAFDMGYSVALRRAYWKRIQGIQAAVDERDLRSPASNHFEKLKGDRQHQRSMRLNDQYRLILEMVGMGSDKTVRIVGIEDYH